MLKNNAIFTGEVYHKRHTPFIHDFKYRVYGFWIDLDALDNTYNTTKTPTYFSFNRWNLFSLYRKDHGPRDGSQIRPWIEAAAKKKGINLTGGKIYMLCFPRVLGYVFNPITLYFCYDRGSALRAILHQVKNTFGDQHGYLLPVIPADKKENQKTIKQDTAKIFHVSPFIQMDSHYNFTVKEPSAEGFHLAIHQTIPDGKMLTATWTSGRAMDFTAPNLLKIFWSIPLLSLKVIIGIHWEALCLWIKGAKYIPKTQPPKKEIS